MNFAQKSRARLRNMSLAITRFWFSIIVFILTTGTVMFAIETETDLSKEILTLVMAGLLGIAVRLICERLSNRPFQIPLLLYANVLLFSVGYYLYLYYTDFYLYLTGVRSGILVFIICMSIIWIPSIKRDEFAFSRSFMVFVKAQFVAILFSLVLMLGLYAIVGAYSFLIQTVDYTIYAHIGALTWFGFFTLYFLSLIPHFPTNIESADDNYLQAAMVPRFLEILLSYIVIPIIIAYTLILLLYIIQNITGDFWNNSLLEPLLVSYVVAGWFTLFLIDTLENKTVRLFKKLFPPLLFIVTALQGASSFIKFQQLGITDGRYFILLFVIFSTLSSLIYLFWHRKMSWIPGLLIFLSIISILPYIDAVSIGTYSQTQQLETTLNRNDMLANNTIQPNSKLSTADKKRIVESYNYLQKVDELDKLPYFDTNYLSSREFAEVFGFDRYSLDTPTPNQGYPQAKNVYIDMDQEQGLQLDVSNANLFLPFSVYDGKIAQAGDTNELTITYQDQEYQLVWEEDAEKKLTLVLKDQEQTLASYDLRFLREIEKLNVSNENVTLPPEELTFSEQFDNLTLTLYVTRLFVEEERNIDGDFYLLLSFTQ
ncbi:hypothetical protein DOK78_002194 [Enterococcus sp. DIV2402]|uniref:DUF4153 domain-containing protein n=1 Tax=Candidatus Enterococcus lowellii TaxID=2230877 RepID=A0ABZ2SSZ0_9ENTE|nr:DUF4153 domain-containing protein [Enterococcus sp. DIV2402]MBO0463681.1 DUF4153 domain-containing protein [Enterococcus sp. DIV2402]